MAWNLATHSPMSLVDDMERLLESFERGWGFGRPYGDEYPPVNMHATDDGAVLTCEIPGMDEKNLELSLENDVLTIHGSRRVSVPEGAKALRRERRDLEFTRSIRLPFMADSDQATARYEHGVLEITLTRREEDKPRRIALAK